jgi:uncharacterized phage-associated protein
VPIAFTFRPEKAIAAISFLVERQLPDLTKGKVDKLLFLADKLHLVRYGRTITGDWYAALQHGPVPSHTDNLLDALEGDVRGYPELAALSQYVYLDRSFLHPRMLSRGACGLIEQQLSESDVEVLTRIVDLFGNRSFTELRGITHELPAWEKAWESRGNANSADMSYEDFFDEDEDTIPGAKEEAVENSALRNYFPEAGWE